MTQTFIFIDGSYFCFYRYHSLINWWKNAYPLEQDALLDPIKNDIFVEKFRKTFVEHIQKLPKNLKLDKNINPHIIVGRDCKRSDIWRNEIFSQYKANRNLDDSFMGGPFFKLVYEENLFMQGGAKAILKHPKLEADDCIALTVKHILEKYIDSEIYIITSDKDYLQIASDKVHLYNLGFKNLAEQKSSSGNSECDLFLKVLTGDTSDNIPSVFPKCGPKTALKYFNNRDLLEKKLAESEEYKKQYEINNTLINFNNIPQNIASEFFSSPINFCKT